MRTRPDNIINAEQEATRITASLKAITGIFEHCSAQYRVLGSVLYETW